jgi:hypothetical protein
VDGSTAVPMSLAEIGGRQEPVSWGVFQVQHDDALYVRWNGAGGYGDPLDREAAAVARDVADGAVSAESARDLYGVVLDDAGEVDAGRTAAERNARRKARLAAPEIEAATDLGIACAACGESAGDGEARASLRGRERRLSELGTVYTTGPLALIREIICPACGGLVAAQVARAADATSTGRE